MIKWIELRRNLLAMDLLHWSFKVVTKSFMKDFADYAMEVSKSYQREYINHV